MSARTRAGQAQMLAWIEGLTQQLAASGTSPGLAGIAPLPAPPAQILCCGMGGSSIAASLLADGWRGLTVPLLVWRDHGLPAWVDERTVVIACSQSGETHETLAAAAEARRRGCPLLAVTGGGRLLAMARQRDGFPAVQTPGGQPPRTLLGASLGALLHLLHRLDCLPDPAPAIAAACGQIAQGTLVQRADGRPGTAADARALAKHLAGRFPVIYTAGAQAHGAGRRWLAQLNENAKAPGHHACFPELAHNEIVGWDLAASQRDLFTLVVLRGADLPAEMARCVEAAVQLLAGQFAAVHEYWASGADDLTRVLGLILFGDHVSAQLAIVKGIDPVPIARIDALKARLRGD